MRLPVRLSLLALAATFLAALASSALAATITVNSVLDTVADDGLCTLREAITAANLNTASGVTAGECAAGAAGADTIQFAIPGSGVRTIVLSSSVLPIVTEPLTINGYSQSGSSVNTLAVGDNAVLLIRIDAAALPSLQRILQFVGPGANGSNVTGLDIGHTSGGVLFFNGTTGGSVTGNFLGTDPTGSIAEANNTPIIETINATGLIIGGTTPAARNVMPATVGAGSGTILISNGGSNTIQGNYIGVNAAGTASLQAGPGTDGISLFASTNNVIGGVRQVGGNVIVTTDRGIFIGAAANGTLIQGNLIGTNAGGTAALGTGTGIDTNNSPQNAVIGGSGAGLGNVISGLNTGIQLIDSAAGFTIRGNLIGTDITGTLPIPNAGDGIDIVTGPSGGTIIGGTAAGDGNVIAFNGSAGIRFGFSSTFTGYGILGNSIFGNGGLGIAFNGGNTPTPNDAGDADTGPNNLQNYPVLTSASVAAGTATISGTLNSTASTSFRVEFFSNVTCDPSGNGEGQTFIGFANVTTDGAGNATFGPLSFPASNSQPVITATATDPGNNTSEFSACLGAPPLPTLSINNVSQNEGNSGTTPFTFTVTLSAVSASTVTVNYATADGSATAPSDYAATSGTLTFNPGVTTQTVTVNVVGDVAVEPNETFTVTLSSPSNATIATGTGTGTIVNDDAPALPTVSINNVSANEGNSGTTPFTFTVTLSAVSASTVTVNYATADGSATAPSDYAATSGTLTFAPGVTTQTITVNVNGDTTVEPNETFVVSLSGAVNATIATGSGTGTVVNDDLAVAQQNVIIPTLGEWGLVLLALLLAAMAGATLRRQMPPR